MRTDFNTAGSRKGSTIGLLKDDSFVYIPATHLKGVLRSEIERFGKTDSAKVLFGSETQENGKYTEPKLKFFDAVCPVSEIRDRESPHVKIDFKFGSAVEGSLFQQKVVPAGIKFIGFICVRGNLTEEEEKILSYGLASAAHYGLGNNRSRGLGSVEIKLERSSIDELKATYGNER
ncbi:MAG: RAMP superfamily CRISPR-associated protein [Candidatus Micrarchaeia archaeon]